MFRFSHKLIGWCRLSVESLRSWNGVEKIWDLANDLGENPGDPYMILFDLSFVMIIICNTLCCQSWICNQICKILTTWKIRMYRYLVCSLQLTVIQKYPCFFSKSSCFILLILTFIYQYTTSQLRKENRNYITLGFLTKLCFRMLD